MLTGLQLPWWVLFPFFAFWISSFILDAKITTSYRDFAKYESNLLFRFLAGRFGVRGSVAIQALIEMGLIVLTGYIFKFRFDPVSTAIVSLVFGLAHLTAWHSNRRFIARCGGTASG